MKRSVALLLLLTPTLSVALSVGDSCLDYWPKNVEKGSIELSYSIDEKCRAVDLEFEVSSPTGAFDEYAECQINRSVLVWDPYHQSEPISMAEYESHLSKYQEENPSRYHQRSISAKEADGTKVGIFCYFTENWEGTEFGVMRTIDEEESVDASYFDTLPRQRLEATFTTEL